MSNDIQALRAKLEGTRGREYWRSLEAVAETSEFKEFLHREFPQNASEWLDPVGRRGFLKLMGASLALAGVSACTRQPDETIVPYVRQPEELRGELGHIAGARTIPVGELPRRLAELAGQESTPIVTVCRSGGRSATAAAILSVAGFKDVRSMEGGMRRWNDIHLPVER